ncbi:unnamed protein product [Anisakis simplex]|uniref:Uncharacterized protein n=1 Tax=Anisakis simplex TaxID=6269 RepID=A0A0M3J6X4_ANISI|nr:unnamed protein product [Anisakis simplex]
MIFLGDGGIETVPLCQQHSPSLALYEEEYNTQGQKIGQMLRSLSLYNAVMQNPEETEPNPKTAKKVRISGIVSFVFNDCHLSKSLLMNQTPLSTLLIAITIRRKKFFLVHDLFIFSLYNYRLSRSW